LRTNDLSELEVSRRFGDDDVIDVRVARQIEPAAPVVPAVPAQLPPPTAADSARPAPPPVSGDPADDPGVVPSPMVGTAYLQAEPTSPAFVKIGDAVTEGQTLLIIEAMKTMNQIPAPKAGRVKRILVEDGSPVEFGAPLVILD
jgi:acetyl-CoA carboxylase biotin carboxyl carrier protein